MKWLTWLGKLSPRFGLRLGRLRRSAYYKNCTGETQRTFFSRLI